MATDLLGGLREYGPIGIVAGLMAIAVYVLYRQLQAAHASEVARLGEELAYQRSRADRLDAELAARSVDIQEKYVTSLEQARSAIAEAVMTMRTIR